VLDAVWITRKHEVTAPVSAAVGISPPFQRCSDALMTVNAGSTTNTI
jgi:hypothetical protein